MSEPVVTGWCDDDQHAACDAVVLNMSGPVRSQPCQCPCHVRAALEIAVRVYRLRPHLSHLAVLHAAGLDGIARALEVEATAHPGIGLDDATARINGWLRPPSPTSPRPDRSASGDGYGLGAPSPTA